MAEPHVLFIPSWFPTYHHPVNGVFIREQALLMSGFARVGVVYPDLRSLRQLRPAALPQQHFQVRETREQGLVVLRHHGWNVPEPRIQARLYLRPALSLVRRYVRRHGRPDVLHGHSACWGGYAARAAARAWSIPYIVTEHWSAFRDGELTSWQKRAAHLTFADADTVISVSDALSRHLAGYMAGGTLEVIANPIDTAYFTPPPAPPPARPFTFVTIAGLNEVKRLDLLLTAYARAFGARPDARLIIGGDGPRRRSLAELAEALGIGDRVRFAGRVDKAGVRAILWQGHVFVSSSRTETFGMALAEAQATGLPAVTTRSGGVESIVEPGSGTLVPVGDVAALADAMARIAEQGGTGFDRPAIRRRIVERYGASSVARAILAVYERARTSAPRARS